MDFKTPIEALQHFSKQNGDKKAFIFLENGETEADSLTYRELERDARRIGAHLQAKFNPGERALLLFMPGLDFPRVLLGCLYAGIIPIPANPPRLNRSAERLEAIVLDSQASLALTTNIFIEDLPKRSEKIPALEKLEWIDNLTLNAEPEEELNELEIDMDKTAFIQYTSGSTGSPRGVEISYQNLAHNSNMIRTNRQVEGPGQTNMVTWAPLFHDMGLIMGFFQCIVDCSLSILMSPISFLQRPARWLEAMSKYRATGSGGPNFSYDLCIRKVTDEERDGLDLSSWKHAWNGAEPVRAETQIQFAKKFASCGFSHEAFHPSFGLAESTLVITSYGGEKTPIVFSADSNKLKQGIILEGKGDNSQLLVSSGKPLLDAKVAIVDPNTSKRCEPYKVGEIWTSGEYVSIGYFNRPEETENTMKAVIADTGEGPFLRTGDLGFMHEDHLYVTGRMKDMIIIKGRNYYPQDIEVTVQRSHSALQAGGGVSFGIDLNGVEHLVIIQEVKREFRKNLDAEEISKAIRFAVAKGHGIRAHAIVFIQPYSLPKTSSGKLMRNGTRAKFLSQELKVIWEWSQPIFEKAIQ